MNIIIEHGTKNREINGPFKLCGNKDDLKLIADAIQKALRARLYLGWVAVGTPEQSDNINTKPEPWE